MRPSWQSNRVLFLTISVFLCVGMIAASTSGFLSPIEDILSIPLNIATGVMNRVALALSNGVGDLAELQRLRERIAELEETLALYQVELVELREIANDYERLAALVDYTSRAEGQDFITAEVINFDQSSLLRTIMINRGTRDALAVGMPVVTNQGLVGRIIDVSADAARVQLITDQNSAISARLQTTRVEGIVEGQLAGNLVMRLIPLGEPVQEGDIVLSSGLGGNLPADIVIGQVTSSRPLEAALNQEAEIRSLVDFDTLELVLVITSFQPVDQTIFDNEDGS